MFLSRRAFRLRSTIIIPRIENISLAFNETSSVFQVFVCSPRRYLARAKRIPLVLGKKRKHSRIISNGFEDMYSCAIKSAAVARINSNFIEQQRLLLPLDVTSTRHGKKLGNYSEKGGSHRIRRFRMCRGNQHFEQFFTVHVTAARPKFPRFLQKAIATIATNTASRL